MCVYSVLDRSWSARVACSAPEPPNECTHTLLEQLFDLERRESQ